MAVNLSEHFKARLSLGNQVSEEFTKVVYECIDKQRHQLNRHYSQNALLTWNGNGITGNMAIQKHYEQLPSSTHHLFSLDVQPVLGDVHVDSFLITVFGNVRYGPQNNNSEAFNQTFILVAEDNKWKIAIDVFRYMGVAL